MIVISYWRAQETAIPEFLRRSKIETEITFLPSEMMRILTVRTPLRSEKTGDKQDFLFTTRAYVKQHHPFVPSQKETMDPIPHHFPTLVIRFPCITFAVSLVFPILMTC